MAECTVCFRHCNIQEGSLGFCGARTCSGGSVKAANYGRITSLALDPVEKKPLARFCPGSLILSAGSYGCNLRCPFCQNNEISWSEEAMRLAGNDASGQGQPEKAAPGQMRTEKAAAEQTMVEYISPRELALMAAHYRSVGNIGVAFTYNEPLIGYEYVLDTARLVHEMGMKTVLVTNGTAHLWVLEKLAPYVDAMNIDLKGFTDSYYRDVLKGSRKMVMDFIERAVQCCHVELTTLIIPGENDSADEMRELSSWVAGLRGCAGNKAGADIPLHISRFFPRFHMQDRMATDVSLVYRLAETAREKLKYVYTGNC